MKAIKLVKSTVKKFSYSLVVVRQFSMSNQVLSRVGTLNRYNGRVTLNIFRLTYWLSINNIRWFGSVEKILREFGLFSIATRLIKNKK